MTSNNKPNPIIEIEKIKLTKEELAEVDRIIKKEPIERTQIYKTRGGHQTEHTTNKVMVPEMVKKRVIQLYGGICCCCGNSPHYNVLYNLEGIKRIARYCSPCFDKWKDRL